MLNRFSSENASNTPDFILAEFLGKCLAAWDEAVARRENWYGCKNAPGGCEAGESFSHLQGKMT